MTPRSRPRSRTPLRADRFSPDLFFPGNEKPIPATRISKKRKMISNQKKMKGAINPDTEDQGDQDSKKQESDGIGDVHMEDGEASYPETK